MVTRRRADRGHPEHVPTTGTQHPNRLCEARSRGHHVIDHDAGLSRSARTPSGEPERPGHVPCPLPRAQTRLVGDPTDLAQHRRRPCPGHSARGVPGQVGHQIATAAADRPRCGRHRDHLDRAIRRHPRHRPRHHPRKQPHGAGQGGTQHRGEVTPPAVLPAVHQVGHCSLVAAATGHGPQHVPGGNPASRRLDLCPTRRAQRHVRRRAPGTVAGQHQIEQRLEDHARHSDPAEPRLARAGAVAVDGGTNRAGCARHDADVARSVRRGLSPAWPASARPAARSGRRPTGSARPGRSGPRGRSRCPPPSGSAPRGQRCHRRSSRRSRR